MWYALARSLGVITEGKKERRYEAEQAARKMLLGIKFERVEKKTLIQYLKDFWAPYSAYAKEAALGDALTLATTVTVKDAGIIERIEEALLQ